jgi:hypothetical protein
MLLKYLQELFVHFCLLGETALDFVYKLDDMVEFWLDRWSGDMLPRTFCSLGPVNEDDPFTTPRDIGDVHWVPLHAAGNVREIADAGTSGGAVVVVPVAVAAMMLVFWNIRCDNQRGEIYWNQP